MTTLPGGQTSPRRPSPPRWLRCRKMGPATLRSSPGQRPAFRRAGRAVPSSAMWRASGRRHEEKGIEVCWRHGPVYPRRLVGDPEAPAVLFCLGDPAAINRNPTVAIVGTRSPTRYGIGVAAQFAADLCRGRGEHRLRPRARDRWRRPRGSYARGCAAYWGRGRRTGRSLSPSTRPPLGQGGRARCGVLGVSGGRAHREVAFSGPQPPIGHAQRRRDRGGESPSGRLHVHGRRRRRTGDPCRRGAWFHPQSHCRRAPTASWPTGASRSARWQMFWRRFRCAVWCSRTLSRRRRPGGRAGTWDGRWPTPERTSAGPIGRCSKCCPPIRRRSISWSA